jgi:hypothetical protein
MAAARDDEGGTPITSKTVLAWGGFLIALGMALLAGVWVIAGMQSKQAVLERDVTNNVLRITSLESKADATNTKLADLSTKMETTLVIVKRIDEKTGQK